MPIIHRLKNKYYRFRKNRFLPFWRKYVVTHRFSYSGVVLFKKSQDELINQFWLNIPTGWKVYAHHMTIELNKKVSFIKRIRAVELIVTHIGITDKVLAVKVKGYPSANIHPHITLAVNPDEGKPSMSKDITNWAEVPEFKVYGIVKNVYVKL